jgi:uncharacterized protein (TIGR00303 family)
VRFALVVGTTRTAAIEGISAAGADPDLMVHTPAADAEIMAYGRPIAAPAVPVSPTGCPTPAIVSRATRELLGFDVLVVDAGLEAPTAAPTVTAGERPGGDIRETEPVPAATDVFERGRELGRALPDEELFLGESIPGGTTTALGVLAALGEPYRVSSSLPENPIALKRSVVSAGLEASGLERGDAAGEPRTAVREMGDPVLAGVAGLAVGASETGTAVTLAGGTQMIAAGALVRHAGADESLTIATTPFVAGDDTADLRTAARDLGMDLRVADPGFERSEHVALKRYRQGVAKEGVGMGGALVLLARSDTPMAQLRDRIERRCDTLRDDDGS